jgi:hypothetical protein
MKGFLITAYPKHPEEVPNYRFLRVSPMRCSSEEGDAELKYCLW